MTESIIRLREQLVELSKDPIETRKLLDQLTEEEIDNANAESHFHVGKKDIVSTKDGGAYMIHRLKDGYLLHYHGGYSILVEDQMVSAASTLQQMMEGVPSDITNEEEKEGVELMLGAAEMVFRLPMFVFSHPLTTLNVATMGVMYMNLLQKMGEVPTEETQNPEFDKFLVQMNDMMENLAKGLEEEGREYEKRNGIDNGKKQSKAEGKGKGKGKRKTKQEGA